MRRQRLRRTLNKGSDSSKRIVETGDSDSNTAQEKNHADNAVVSSAA